MQFSLQPFSFFHFHSISGGSKFDTNSMAIGRSDSLQELITILESLFPETIIGSDINLVKHLFYYLKADDKEIDFIYNEKLDVAIVHEIYDETVMLDVPNFHDEGQRRARIRFEIMNIMYQFDVLISDLRNDQVLIKIPSELQSMQLRQSKRIIVDDLFMNFIILFRSLSGGARSVGKNLYAERRYPFLMREIRKDKPNLKLINIMITDYIKSVSKYFDIVIYKQDEEIDDFERFIRKAIGRTEKSIYISDCNKLEKYIEPSDDEILTTFNYEFKELAESNNELEALSFFEELSKKENRQFYVSYIYSAIRIYDQVVGYIKVYSTAMERFTITHPQAVFIHELSEIANYAITKVTIQVSSYETYAHTTKIIDISMDGLLFEIGNKKLFNYLKRHNILKMNIPLLPNVELSLRGEIVRFIERDGSYLIGVNFFDSNPDDMLHLETYLFEKSLNTISE